MASRITIRSATGNCERPNADPKALQSVAIERLRRRPRARHHHLSDMLSLQDAGRPDHRVKTAEDPPAPADTALNDEQTVD